LSNNVDKVVYISCVDYNIKNISWIWNFVNLNHLRIRHNKLTSLPDSIWNLTNLTDIGLWSNWLIKLPSSIWNLTNLVKLSLYNNNLKILPSSIWNLTNLNYFYVNNNQLISLPSSLTNLKKIWNLGLSNNLNLWNLNGNFNGSSNSQTANIADTNWDWIPNENMTIKWNWNNNVIITTWN